MKNIRFLDMKDKLKEVIKFTPLLLLYVIIVLIFSKNVFEGDEGRYIGYAANLLHGFYSPRGPDINLWNGPGYPIILVPFLAFHIPLIFIKLLNAAFLFLSVIYFYFTVFLFVRRRYAIIFSYLLGLYFPLFLSLPLIITESFAVFLVCGFMFHLCKLSNGIQKRGNLTASIFFLGYLALTKVLFGVVIIVGILISMLLILFKLRRIFLFALPVYFGALIVCVPYLVYTNLLTGKFCYWGNAGGLSLYWMSASSPGELGDAYALKWVLEQPDSGRFKEHREFFNRTVKLTLIRQDEELRKQAITNILSNPKKFIINWVANTGRLVFSYPYSYTSQKLSTYFYIIPNMFIIAAFIFCLYAYFVRLSIIPREIHNLLLFGGVAFFGSTLLAAYPRYLFPLIPIILLFIAFALNNLARIGLIKQ